MSRRAGLDKDTVIQAAAELVDEQGIEHLSLIQLAERLHVRSPSLYNHVKGLGELQRDLAIMGARELHPRLSRATIGKSKDEAVMAFGIAYRAFAKEHPGLYAMIERAPDKDDQEWQAAGGALVEIALAVLAGYGLHDEAALHAVRALRSIVHGFVSLEKNGGFALSLDRDESFRLLLQMFITGVKLNVFDSS